MKPETLPPIPMPPGQRWRLFREKFLPGVAFLGVLGVTAWLWGMNLANPLLLGQAEGPQAEVISPGDGQVVRLDALLYGEVKAGEIVAVVAVSTPEVLSNKLAVINAEMDAAQATAGYGPGDRVRLAQFEMDWLNLRAELAALRVRHQYAQSELARVEQLEKLKIDNQSNLEIAQRDVRALADEISGKEKTVAVAEAAIQTFNSSSEGSTTAWSRSPLRLAEQQMRLAESELAPTILRAPISGRITRIATPVQSTVTRGQPLLTISDSKVDRIVGYLPQPLRLEPKVGMSIEVRSRGANRVVGRTVVTEIGPRIELFDAPLRVRGMGAAQERGLPVVVKVPDNLHLRPGELVDLRLLTD